jgi:hypothetical protein
MKKTISGLNAFNLMLTTTVPDKTRTYSPISHSAIINQTRREIGKTGFRILGDDYRATSNGQLAIGTYRIEYKQDPDIELMVAFLNSYDKSYAFRFAIGANVKASGNSMFLSDTSFGFYKKFHKGDASILSASNISKMISSADKYWESLIQAKDAMKSRIINDRKAYEIIGHLFFDSEILNGYQMNIIKEQIKKVGYEYNCHPKSLWSYFNHITLSLKDAHPSDWIDYHKQLFEILNAEFSLVEEIAEETQPVFAFTDPLFA